MSLILEALKKSEAERQLGRAPGLTTPMPVRGRSATGERAPLAWITLAALLVVGGGTWWLLSARPAPQALAPPASRPDATRTQPADAAATLPDSPTRVSAPPAPPTQRVAAAAPPRPPDPPALRETLAPEPDAVMAAPLPRDPEFSSTERESVPIEAALPPPVAAPTPAPAPPDAKAPGSASAVAPAAATAAAAAPPGEDLPRLDQLGGPQREALPPLKQTMHVYAEQPADRFVLIDGHRYREGDRLAANLQLSEIRRDGTVFVLDGLRFLLPRP